MSKFFTLCRANNKKHGLQDQQIDFKSHISKRMKLEKINFYCSILFFSLICISVFFYLVQITSSATQGFEVSAKQEKIQKLKLQNEDLKSHLSGLEKIDDLQKKAVKNGMVEAQEISYLKYVDSAVALK
jgi:cell division protein FtsL